MKPWTPVLALTLSLAAISAASAQTPLNLIVGYPPGGSSDRVARLVSERLGKELGVPVVIENRTGAGGRIAAQYVARASAKDNVLMLGNPAVMVVAPLVYDDVGYDAAKDFQTVALVAGYRFGFAVPADSPVKDVAGLRQTLAANPGQFNLGVPATGSLPHFFGLMLGKALGENPEVVGYRGSGPLVTELIGGHLKYGLDTFDALEPQHAGGKLRILAVSGEQREATLPEVPTFKEAGIDVVATAWNGIFAPAAMPAADVERYGAAIKKIAQDPAFAQIIRDTRMEPIAADAKESQKLLDEYRAQWAPVVKASGFRAAP
ncbi:ABC transporter substrate-binding protein [Achromobacter sp. GG226]|uniref:tripartite tricarboxylate transporter substrate-binding protein n=1 Tax=Verticiella alkaliphila TaxID=2779529 RepID=UPI001C0B7627|nr:tripartite tricarboxylate transporter substrate-binding protein [Verticiella sp. GG226]MBU4610570.1 ABC transporter substrate-binding protein [Verticiella sp. GG226]